MAWRTRDQIVAALASGQTVGYGCGSADVPFRTFLSSDVDSVPSQAQIDADEASCRASASGGGAGLSADQVASIATGIAVTQRQEATAELTPALDAAQQAAADAVATAQAAVQLASRNIEAAYVAGEALPGHCVVKLVDRKVWRASCDDSPLEVVGVVRDATPAGDLATVTSAGLVNGFSGLVPEAYYYVGQSGAVMPTPPAMPGCWVKIIGVGQTADTMLVRIVYPAVQRA